MIVDNDGYMQCPLAFRENAEEELKKQRVFRGSTIAELAEKLRIPAAVFVKTIKDYNESVSSGNDRQFGRGRESMLRHYTGAVLGGFVRYGNSSHNGRPAD